MSNIFFISFNCYSFSNLDFSCKFFSDKVLDFDLLLITTDQNVNGEVRLSLSHSKFKTLSDTFNHISNVRNNCDDLTLLFSSTEPHYNKMKYFGRKWRIYRSSFFWKYRQIFVWMILPKYPWVLWQLHLLIWCQRWLKLLGLLPSGISSSSLVKIYFIRY